MGLPQDRGQFPEEWQQIFGRCFATVSSRHKQMINGWIVGEKRTAQLKSFDQAFRSCDVLAGMIHHR